MQRQNSLPYDQSAAAEWSAIVLATPEPCRAALDRLMTRDGEKLAHYFYEHMLSHPQASVFLSAEAVHQRLHQSMTRWLREIFRHPMDDTAGIVAHQRLVGEVHARIQLPVHLVSRGARLLKHHLHLSLAGEFSDAQLCAQASTYANGLIDLALELMSVSYERNSQREARTDEAYRLFAIGQNVGVERERQRAVLMEWTNEVMLALHRAGPAPLPALRKSEFGMWFHHKAIAMFEGDSEVEHIVDIIERIDNVILPLLRPRDGAAGEIDRVGDLQDEVDNLKFLLATLFERNQEAENGRDALTRLFSRRFLPAVISREINVSQKRKSSFALMLIDLDHFKRVNDTHGHDAGDLVLQQASSLLLSSVRNGDFVFRYGGEELLVMLVEVTQESALRIAELIRSKFETSPFSLSQGRSVSVTASIGLALFDGHPDHQYLVKRADAAMYEAKQSGRNRVVLAP
ncbi:GGDEF domain-containing protein [Duganella fentianensis]|uniref:GGDEF domain-containing protein n=1 Tax=Duganella fentianensis TaxID=2692177 RepID=UPI0032B2CCDE